jgi:hypothetical protein
MLCHGLQVIGSRLCLGGRPIMATVGQSGALRRVTVHYANSPTRSTVAEVSLDDLDDELLQFVLADLLPGQVRHPCPFFVAFKLLSTSMHKHGVSASLVSLFLLTCVSFP